jgi:hypothetical protein
LNRIRSLDDSGKMEESARQGKPGGIQAMSESRQSLATIKVAPFPPFLSRSPQVS